MTVQRGDELVGVYMARLGAALASLPPERRDEIAGEIANHIAEERAGFSAESDADVRSLLERVGDPAEIAAAADAQPFPSAAPTRAWGALEIWALILTPFLWPIGVILLWLSPAWRLRDKLIGTLLPPGGYAAVLGVGPGILLAGGWGSCMTESDSSGGVISQSCTGAAALPDWVQMVFGVAGLVAWVILLALPLAVAIYLGLRLNRGTGAGPAHNAGRDERTTWTGGSAAVS